MVQRRCFYLDTTYRDLWAYLCACSTRDYAIFDSVLYFLDARWVRSPSLRDLRALTCNRNNSRLVAKYSLPMTPWCEIPFVLFTRAGYHRLWSHRSYTASLPLQVFLLLGGTSAVQGSCYWWARAHRSHHRYTDTDLDPYNSSRGLFWTHIGWIIFRSELHSGPADISDLQRDELIRWQHRHYFVLLVIFGFLFPAAVPGFLFDDWLGGMCFAGAMRLTIAHHVCLLLLVWTFYWRRSRVHSVSTRSHTGWERHPTTMS